jgi:hypothetical protein
MRLGLVLQLVAVRWLGMVLADPRAAPRSRSWPAAASPGLPTRFAQVLGRHVAAGEPVTVQRTNPAQRIGCG